MGTIGLIADAEVPEGSVVEITVSEDVDGDGEYENHGTQRLQNGEYVYEIDGLQGERDNGFATEINLERNPDAVNSQGPSVSRLQLIIPGPSESNEVDPKAVVSKFDETGYFLHQMKEGQSEAYRFNLSGFLSACYSIDEMVKTEWGEWADSQGEIDLHDLIIETRHQTVHLQKPAKGSLKPPLGHSLEIDFGNGAKQDYFFEGVSEPIVDEFVPKKERVESADCAKNEKSSDFAHLVPVTEICQVYYALLKQRLQDWLDSRGFGRNPDDP